MIVMELKSADDILSMLEGKQRIVLFGDSGCAQLCDVGGILQLEDMEDLLRAHGKEVLGYVFVEGGICDMNALRQAVAESSAIIRQADALLVQACGVATQTLTQLLPDKESFPATDSEFLGNMPERHHHYEQCALCGECILHLTGGICPIARCAKGILNGPCGGSVDGKCERDRNTDCVWQLIYERLKSLGKLENIRRIWEIKDWSKAKGPRAVVHLEE
ncbi:MAG: methylenetetrahydrofolate reductase C-terminal domain-containing protein [Candidatus Thorarchaeota archaeon]|nr:methylenetetrahydrofolate reductase C-terminal domain-containing protein [Candidatus Thorarchaeota archaeon]